MTQQQRFGLQGEHSACHHIPVNSQQQQRNGSMLGKSPATPLQHQSITGFTGMHSRDRSIDSEGFELFLTRTQKRNQKKKIESILREEIHHTASEIN